MKRRLHALKARHEILDAKIRQEALRPAADEFRLQQMKRIKLALRDQIAEEERSAAATGM